MHVQVRLGQRLADDGERAPLPRADLREHLEVVRRNRQHVALLRLVAPDLERRQRRIRARNAAKRDPSAATAVLDELGQGVGQSAGADVVDETNRILGAKLPAAIDHFLAAVLHLGVVPLDRREVQLGVARAGRHG